MKMGTLEIGPQGQKVYRYTATELGPLVLHQKVAEAPDPYRFNDGRGDHYIRTMLDQEPWLALFKGLPEPSELDPAFEQLFGPRPQMRDGDRTPTTKWNNARKAFVGVGYPFVPTAQIINRFTGEPYDLDEIAIAEEVLTQWELGRLHFYRMSSTGWWVAFPESEHRDLFVADGNLFEADPDMVLHRHWINQVIAKYQVRVLQMDGDVAERHPFLRELVL